MSNERTLLQYIETCANDSLRWFGNETYASITHQVLALCGEAGELANKLKKIDRGDVPFDNDARMDLGYESIDIFIYLCNFWGAMRLDPNELFETKREQNEERFGNGSQS